MRSLLIAIACLGLCSSARADRAATLDRYRPAPLPEDGFALSGTRVGGHLDFSAQLHLDYANDPLVYEDVAGRGDSELVSLVSDQLAAHLVLALGLFDMALVYLELPVQVWMQGDRLGDQPTATGFGVGDLLLGGRVGVYRSKYASVALQLSATVPSGESGEAGRPGVAGDAGATVHSELTSEFAAGPVALRADVGARWRKDTTFAGTRFTDVITYGVGAALPLWTEKLHALLELRGETPMDDAGERSSSPLEALLGFKLTSLAHWTFGGAGGAGLLRGYGSPDMRVVLMTAFSSASSSAAAPDTPAPDGDASRAAPAPQPTPVAIAEQPVAPAVDDRDHDGVADLDDRCPIAPGAPEQDGCPRLLRYDEASGEIVLLAKLTFEGNPPEVRSGNEAMIAELSAILRANPKLQVRVEAHMSRGSAARKQLTAASVQRAQAVADLLIATGVAETRVEAVGCGSNRPLVPDRGSQRLRNERVQVYVVAPLPASGLRSMLGCTGPEPPPEAPAAPAPAPEPAPTAATSAATAPAPLRVLEPAKPVPPPTPAAAPRPTPAATPTAAATVAKIAAGATAASIIAALAREPSADADRDGTNNQQDECPLAPGAASAHGCPPNHRLDIEKGSIELLKPIRFEEGAAELQPRAAELIDEIATTLRANPQMKIAIEAHSAQSGADANRSLTQKRAANVRKRLSEQGVAPAHITAYGCGEGRPIAPNNVPWGRKKNDRLELHVLDPAPNAGVHSSNDCAASE